MPNPSTLTLNTLPKEIKLHIYSFLNNSDIRNVALTSTINKQDTDNNDFWHEKCKRDLDIALPKNENINAKLI